jgi:integral membrane protein (TIGR01906 family)
LTSERSGEVREGVGVRFAAPLLACSVPFLLLSSAIRVEMNSLGLYARGFRVYGVSHVTGLSMDYLEQAASRLIHYFNSLVDSPQMVVSHADGIPFELFHDYELIHLADVKVLFAANSVVQACSLLLVVAIVLAGLSLGRRADVLVGLQRGAIATLVLLAASAMAFVVDFGQMFVVFHLVAFDNPFWLLDPLTDYLVMLFPFGFWQDMFLIAGASTGLAAGGLYVFTTRSIAGSRRPGTNRPRPTAERP